MMHAGGNLIPAPDAMQLNFSPVTATGEKTLCNVEPY